MNNIYFLTTEKCKFFCNSIFFPFQLVSFRLQFMHCYVGEVGSVHDARVFRKSSLGNNLANMIPDNFHLVGDGAYPLQINLLIPFKDNGHLTRLQINYNRKLSSARSTIEQAFSLLKN